jgi:hypothetical protein
LKPSSSTSTPSHSGAVIATQVGSQTAIIEGSRLLIRNHLLIIALLSIVALGIRFYHIDDPPLSFHATRQYRSLLIARGLYFESLPSLPEWKKQVANISMQRQGILEPPIMEFIASTAYRAIGAEVSWIPRVLSSLFWVLGGWFLYFIATRVVVAGAALFSTAFYLFLPFAVVASRSFQPDSLMIMLLLASILATLRYYEHPLRSRLAIAVMLSASTVIVKPMSLFVIVAAFLSLAIWRYGLQASITNINVVVYLIGMLLPTIMIYLYGIVTSKFLFDEASTTLLPNLFLTLFFWRGLLTNIDLVVGFAFFIAALLGTLMVRVGLPRALIIGLWVGYIAFNLTFNYNVATHDYYQLQLIPIVALSMAPIVALLMNHLSPMLMPSKIVLWGILFLALSLSIVVARSRLIGPDAEHTVKIAQEIGARVNHSTRTIYLSSDYGVPLEYYGELSGSPWPVAADLEWDELAGVQAPSAEERFNNRFLKDAPEYFIVTNLQEFEAQPDLEHLLSANFPVLLQTDDYLIYDLRKKAGSGR